MCSLNVFNEISASDYLIFAAMNFVLYDITSIDFVLIFTSTSFYDCVLTATWIVGETCEEISSEVKSK